MSVAITLNGSVYIYPTNNDVGWGTNATNYAVAIAAGTLQKTGGTFLLSAETDFGAAFGLKALYYKSRTSNVASTGIIRLANNSDSVSWRDATNTFNHELIVNASDQLCFDGTPLAAGGSGTVNPGTQYQLAYYATSSNAVNGLTLITANRALQSDASGLPIASTTTATELGYVSGVTSAIQTQLNAKASSTLLSSHLFVGNGSNIATDTAITGDILISNTGVTSINTGVIVDADINNSAAISLTKLAATTISRALISNGSGFITVSPTTATEIGFVNGVTSAIQTQINTKAPSANPTFTGTINTPLTASRVVKTDGSSNLTTGQVNLASTNEVTGILPVTNGGTGLTTKQMTTGSYTGNGTTQSIAHGLGATPDFVIISVNSNGNNVGHFYITGMTPTTGGQDHDFNGTANTNGITSVDSTNINIGANVNVNQNGVAFLFVAFKAQ